MTTTLSIINYISHHPFYSKKWANLKPPSQKIVTDFLDRHFNESKEDFELKVNRLFLDKPDKPKDWTMISEFLLVANTVRSL